MNHNYEYLHSVVRGIYTDLPVTSYLAVPSLFAREVAAYSSIFDCHSAGVHTNYCYFMVPDPKGVPTLFFAKTALKENSTNLAYYAQCAGWKFNNVYRLTQGAQLPTDEFDSIFSFRFFTEGQMDAYAAGDRSTAFGAGGAEMPESAISIAPTAIQAILHGTAAHWILGQEPVYVEVPADVDYDSYVLAAVREIYSYFPVAFKTNIGFASYIAPQNESRYSRVGLVFTPAARATANTIRLDGSSAAACQNLCGISFGTKLNAIFKHLSLLSDPVRRKSFLEAVLIDAEASAADNVIGTIHTDNYLVLGEGIRILDLEGSVTQLFPEWLRFSQQYEEYPAGIAGEVRHQIDSRLNVETFGAVLADSDCFPQPKAISDLRDILEKLTFFTPTAELKQCLWDYARRLLLKGNFTDDSCFHWLKDNRDFLLTLTASDDVQALTDTFASRCANAILQNAKTAVEDEEITDCIRYRGFAQETIYSAIEAANHYQDSTAQSAPLLLLAENRIALRLAADLERFRNAKLTTPGQILSAIHQYNQHFQALPPKGKYAHADTVRADALQLIAQRKKEYVQLVTASAAAKVQKLPVENRTAYRAQYQEILKKASEEAGRFADVTGWKEEQTRLCEDRITAHIHDAMDILAGKDCKTADQYRDLMNQCKLQLADLGAEGVSESTDHERARIQDLLSELNLEYKKLLGSTETLIESFEGKYFAGLDKYADRIQTLTDDQKKLVLEALAALRPVTLADYLATYSAETGAPADAGMLIRSHREASKLVAEDLQKFLSHAIPMGLSGKNLGQIVQELDRYIAWGTFFRTGKDVVVRVDLNDGAFLLGPSTVELDAAVLRDIVTLTLEPASAASLMEPQVNAVVACLLEKNILTHDHGYAILEMYHRCGYTGSAEEMVTKLNGLEGTPIKEAFAQELKSRFDQTYTARFGKKVTVRNVIIGVLSGLTVAAVGVIAAGLIYFNNYREDVNIADTRQEQTITQQQEQLTEQEQTITQLEETIRRQAEVIIDSKPNAYLN